LCVSEKERVSMRERERVKVSVCRGEEREKVRAYVFFVCKRVIERERVKKKRKRKSVS